MTLFGFTTNSFLDYIRDYETGSTWNIANHHLDLGFARIENLIKVSKLGNSAKNLLLSKVNLLFDYYYRISGYKYKNPYYRPARLLIRRVGEVLVKAEVITENENKLIDNLINQRFATRNLWTIQIEDSSVVPNIKNYVDYMNSILKAAQSKLSKSDEAQIKQYFYDFAKLIPSAMRFLEDYRPSFRKNLIQEIIERSIVLGHLRYKASLDRLLFGDKSELYKYKYLHDTFFCRNDIERINDPPPVEMVEQILYNVNLWTEEMLNKEGVVIIDSLDLELIKHEISDTIKRWLASNLYSKKGHKYFAINPYTDPHFDMLFELARNIRLSVAAKYDDPGISFNKAAQKLRADPKGLAKFMRSKSKGFQMKTIKRFMAEIGQWATDESSKQNLNMEKMTIYLRALRVLLDYKMTLIGHTSKYHVLWNDKVIKAYHCVFLFYRQLGIDWIDISTLDDNIYRQYPLYDKDGNIHSMTSDYRTHHPDKSSTMSLLFDDLIETSVFNHKKWDLIGEHRARILIDGVQQLMLDNTINWNTLTADELKSKIDAIFSGTWVLDPNEKYSWANFQKNVLNKKLNDIIERMKYKVEHPNDIGGFLEKFRYNNLKNRQYMIVMNDGLKHLNMFIKHHTSKLATYSDLLAHEFKQYYYKYICAYPNIYKYLTFPWET